MGLTVTLRGRPELHLRGFEGVSGTPHRDPLHALSELSSAPWHVHNVEVGRKTPVPTKTPGPVVYYGAAAPLPDVIVSISSAELLVILNS